jgi:hypothetical protein
VAFAGFHDDVAALAAVTAGWPTARDELLPAKSKAAVAAIAGFDSDCGLVDEHSSQPSGKNVVGRVVRRWPLGIVVGLRTSVVGKNDSFDLT